MKHPSWQDAHLDCLLRLAMEQLDAEDTARFVQSPDPDISVSDAQRADRAFQAALSGALRRSEQNVCLQENACPPPHVKNWVLEVKRHE